MFNLGPMELVVILVVVLIIFGPARLPQLGSSLGEGIKNFRKSYRESKAIDITPDENQAPAGGSESRADANAVPRK